MRIITIEGQRLSATDADRMLLLLEQEMRDVDDRFWGATIRVERGQEAGLPSSVTICLEPPFPRAPELTLEAVASGVYRLQRGDDTGRSEVCAKILDLALARVAQPVPEIAWWASIETLYNMSAPTLYVPPPSVDGLLLAAPDEPFLERVHDPDHPMASSDRQSSPWTVHGLDRGMTLRHAMPTIMGRLDRLTSLLTLVTAAVWHVRDAPGPSGVLSGEVPHLPPADPSANWAPIRTEYLRAELEAWYLALVTGPELDGMVRSFAHARRVEREAPSSSFLTYVAIVERVGLSQRPGVGAQDQFRHGLHTILSNKDARRFRKLYDRRSMIAHSGVLLGGEHSGGRRDEPIRVFEVPAHVEFRDGILPAMREVTRRILEKILTEDEVLRERIATITTRERSEPDPSGCPSANSDDMTQTKG